MSFFHKTNYQDKPELNITPLVDVMLVLLAILMVTAPVLEYEESINIPQGSKSKSIRDSTKIDISIDRARAIRINNEDKFNFLNFADSFVLLMKDKNKDTPIHIRADRNLKYDDIMYILKTVKEVGFSKVSLITDG